MLLLLLLLLTLTLSAPQEEKPRVAQALNAQRKQMLQRLRQQLALGDAAQGNSSSSSSSSVVDELTQAFQHVCMAATTAGLG